MIVLSVMVKLPMQIIAATGFLIVFGHNLLTPINFQPGETGFFVWTILHDRAYLISEGALKIRASYPVLPWIGVILLGYFSGQLYGKKIDPDFRIKFLTKLGLGSILLLLILRGFNIYGETLEWVNAKSAIYTIMSFFNFTKYPPSLHFLLMNLGLSFLLLAWFERLDKMNRFLNILKIFGSAPMFFYILHLYSLLIVYWVLIAIFGANQGDLFGVNHFGWVWVMSAIMSLALYYPTKKFAVFKKQSSQAWLRYF
jgi:uncharacterized membrane protein